MIDVSSDSSAPGADGSEEAKQRAEDLTALTLRRKQHRAEQWCPSYLLYSSRWEL
jgi:hypothetical protein